MSRLAAEISVEDLGKRSGEVIGTSKWFVIDQPLINQFAMLTQDEQFIHVDAEKARQTEFGGTIAHGFLVLSFLSAMYADAVPPLSGSKVAINAGLDRIRFVSPVRCGDRIRASFTLARIEEQKPGQWRLAIQVEVRAEGVAKPALVAEWLQIWIIDGPAASGARSADSRTSTHDQRGIS